MVVLFTNLFSNDKAVDAKVFDNFPNIAKWIETCTNEIVDYEEMNQMGVDAFKKMAEPGLGNLE